MKPLSFLAATVAALAAASPAPAQIQVSVPTFDSVELRGGGTLTIRHGAAQRVTLLSGNLETSRFSVDDEGRLTIRACEGSCRNYRLRVEIVTPEIDAVAINGGGSVRAEGNFPQRGNLALAVHGGGALDMMAIEAGSVAAAIRGGGSIRTHARSSLAASINGGGSVVYEGEPDVSSSINGGGSVNPAR